MVKISPLFSLQSTFEAAITMLPNVPGIATVADLRDSQLSTEMKPTRSRDRQTTTKPRYFWLSLIYSAGLRGQEVINLKISDVDFERQTIHIFGM